MTALHPSLQKQYLGVLTSEVFSSEPTEAPGGGSLQDGTIAASDGTSSTNGFGTAGVGFYHYFSGAWTPFSGGTIGGLFSLTGDISPSQITANQNNYNPTGLSTASTIRASSDATRTITGLAGGSDGRVVLFHNIGAENIIFAAESGSSTAANRFDISTDFTLEPKKVALLNYDATSSRWRLISGGGGGGSSFDEDVSFTADISPSEITSNQDDYAPTGFSTASVMKLTSDAVRNITGLAGGSDGRSLYVINEGSFNIVLSAEDTNSTAANRWGVSTDRIIRPDEIIFIHYDSTASRWRILPTTEGVTSLSAEVSLTGILTPAQITSNQDDYNPTGLSTCSTLRLDSDASRNITGIAGGSSGRTIFIQNVGSNNIVLVNQSASSSADNRFAMSANITIAPDQLVMIQYDDTDSRWRATPPNETQSLPGGSSVPLVATWATFGSSVDASSYDDGDLVMLVEYNSGDGIGGGLFEYASGASSANTGTRVAPSAGGGLFIRRLENPARVTSDMFGARRNGSTNDATAIQNAINYVESLGGGRVDLPEGHYKIGSTITVGETSANVVLAGAGMGLDAIASGDLGGTTLEGTATTGAIIKIELGATVENFTLNADASRFAESLATGATGARGIMLEADDTSSAEVIGAMVRNVRICRQPSDAIGCSGPVRRCRFDGVIIEDCKGDGFRSSLGALTSRSNTGNFSQNIISRCRITEADGHAIRFGDTADGAAVGRANCIEFTEMDKTGGNGDTDGNYVMSLWSDQSVLKGCKITGTDVSGTIESRGGVQVVGLDMHIEENHFIDIHVVADPIRPSSACQGLRTRGNNLTNSTNNVAQFIYNNTGANNIIIQERTFLEADAMYFENRKVEDSVTALLNGLASFPHIESPSLQGADFITVPDDDCIEIEFYQPDGPQSYGIICAIGTQDDARTAACAFRTGSSAYARMLFSSGDSNAAVKTTAGEPSGANGTDGELNFRAHDQTNDKFWIINKRGAQYAYSLLIIGGLNVRYTASVVD